MKASLIFSVFFVGFFASAPAFSAEGRFGLSCKFQGLEIFEPSFSQVRVQCDQGLFTLDGTNNSPCRAATHLAQYFSQARTGESVQLEGLTYEASGYGGLETHTDVVLATREGTDQIFEAPTVMVHGKPKKCNTTHVSIRRSANTLR